MAETDATGIDIPAPGPIILPHCALSRRRTNAFRGAGRALRPRADS